MAYDDSPVTYQELWATAAQVSIGRSMFVLAVGFDPRCLLALQQFLSQELPRSPLIVRVELPPPPDSSHPLVRTLADDNLKAFEYLTSEYEVRVFSYPAVHDKSNAGPMMARQLTDASLTDEWGHLLIDISSLPSSLYFPLIVAALKVADKNSDKEIQVVACENPGIDAGIVELDVSDAGVVGGFRGSLDADSIPTDTLIWAPVIGEHSEVALRSIFDFLDPAETIPILPFPARDPRRADRLLLSHQRILFDEFRIAPENIIYADEQNPFDLYRILSKLWRDYEVALSSLGTTTIALSSHSSKVLSLGVLFAAYELDLPIVAASAGDYQIQDGVDFTDLSRHNRLGCIWLAGDPYRAL